MTKRRYVRCGPWKLYRSSVHGHPETQVAWTGPGVTQHPSVVLRRYQSAGGSYSWYVTLFPLDEDGRMVALLESAGLVFCGSANTRSPRRPAKELWRLLSRMNVLADPAGLALRAAAR